MAQEHYDQYRENTISHADPVKLVELMYEGAITFVRRAQKCIGEKDPEGTHNNILRAYAIVAELMATLDFDQGGEIAQKLEQCYDFVLHLLKEADICKDSQQLEQVLKVLEPMSETWKEAFNGDGQPASSPGAAETEEDQEGLDSGASRQRKTLDTVG